MTNEYEIHVIREKIRENKKQASLTYKVSCMDISSILQQQFGDFFMAIFNSQV